MGADGGPYILKALTLPQFCTLERLTDLIIPSENGKPGAVAAFVPEWIDTLLGVNDELKSRYKKGLAWIDTAMTSRGAADFVTAAAPQQVALLDLIAYQKNRSPELDPGIDFFILVRRMTVDGFYTSRIGMRDLIPAPPPGLHSPCRPKYCRTRPGQKAKGRRPSAQVSLRVCELRLGDFERREHAALRFTADSASNHRAHETAQPVRAAAVHGDEPEAASSRVGHQHSQFDRRPEIVAGIEHLRQDDHVRRLLRDGHMVDPNGRLEAELRFLPVQKRFAVRQRRLRIVQEVVLQLRKVGGQLRHGVDHAGELLRDERRPARIAIHRQLRITAFQIAIDELERELF